MSFLRPDFPGQDAGIINDDWIIQKMYELINEWKTVETDFKKLQDYVTNYFNNLDITEEVSKKIDSMIKDGTFANIIASMYSNPIVVVPDVETLKNTDASIGQIVKTMSYYNNTGYGGAYYVITKNNPDLINIEMTNGNTATLLNTYSVTAGQLGAKFNAENFDSTECIQYGIDHFTCVKLEPGTLYITSIEIHKPQIRIMGSGFRKTIVKSIVNHDNRPMILIENDISIIRYIDLWDFSLDGNEDNQIATFNAIELSNVSENSVYAFADIFFKRLYIINFTGNGIHVKTKYNTNPTEYFIQYLRLEELQIAYCKNNIYCENVYYLQIIHCYLQFPKQEDVVLLKQANYFKIIDSTLNTQTDYPLLSLSNCRFSNIMENNLQGNEGNAIECDACSNINVSNNISVNCRFLLSTKSTCTGTVADNNIYNGTVLSDSSSSLIALSTNLGDQYKPNDTSAVQPPTGYLGDRILCSYSGALPTVYSPLVLSGQNYHLNVENNIMKPPTNTRAILILNFQLTGDDTVYIEVNNDERQFQSGETKSSYTGMWYLNNISDIEILIKSKSQIARFNGGTCVYLNLSKY